MGFVAHSIFKPFQGIYDKNDLQRKKDLFAIAKALESYKSNYGSYPDYDQAQYIIRAHEEDIKWGDPWTPYISVLPKDPWMLKRYVYWVDREGGFQSYRLYASLNSNDPICGTKDCPHAPGQDLCGYMAACNYGVTSGNISP